MDKMSEAVRKINDVLKSYGLGGVLSVFSYDENLVTFQMPEGSSIQFVADGSVVVAADSGEQLARDLDLLGAIPEMLRLNQQTSAQVVEQITTQLRDNLETEDEQDEVPPSKLLN